MTESATQVREVAAYFASNADVEWSAEFTKQAAALDVTTVSLLDIGEQKLEWTGVIGLTPQQEELFSFSLRIPASWHLTNLKANNQTAITSEVYSEGDTKRIVVKLSQPIPINELTQLTFSAEHVPDSWLTDWDERNVNVPVLQVVDARSHEGAIAVRPGRDFVVREGKTDALTSLDQNEVAEYGLNVEGATLAYFHPEATYSADVAVTRGEAHLTAQTYSFFKIAPELVTVQHDLLYQIREARTRSLQFLLPIDTPTSISVSDPVFGLVKESFHEETEDGRLWTVQLKRPVEVQFHLRVRFEQKQAEDKEKETKLALAFPKLVDAKYQVAFAAVEGHAELEIDVETTGRPVDIGELVDANYLIGTRLLGAYSFAGREKQLSVVRRRPEGYELPSTIVQTAELHTQIGGNRVCQNRATFQLLTKDRYLVLQLPKETELWSIFVDDQPAKPQRAGGNLIISLPTKSQGTVRTVQVAYQGKLKRLRFTGEVNVLAPKLSVREGEGDLRPVAMADLIWHLYLPDGYAIAKNRGNVAVTNPPQRTSAVSQVGAVVHHLGGGFMRGGVMAMHRHRESFDAVAYDYSGADYGSDEGIETGEASQFDDWAQNEADAELDNLVEEVPAVEFERSRRQSSGFKTKDSSDDAKKSELNEDLKRSTDFYEKQDGGGGFGGKMLPPNSSVAANSAAAPPEPTAPRSRPQSATRQPAAPKPTTIAGSGVDQPFNGTPGETAAGTVHFHDLNAYEGLAQTQQAATETGKGAAGKQWAGRQWAMQGLNSLKIDLHGSRNHVTLRSLGDDPLLEVTIVDVDRIQRASWGVGLLVVMLGLLLLRSSLRKKCLFIAIVLLVSALLPILLSVSPTVAQLFDYAFYAGCILVVVYLLAAIAGSVCQSVGSVCRWTGNRFPWLKRLVAACVAAAVSVALQSAYAAPPAVPSGEVLVRPAPPIPVTIPKDAIVIPYDPDNADLTRSGEKVLLPYTEYQRLWNLAFPDDQDSIQTPLAYAISQATYTATLNSDEDLTLAAKVYLDVYDAHGATIPLSLRDAVITSATLDDEPARFQFATSGAENQQQRQVQKAANAPPTIQKPLVLLRVAQKGRHVLTLQLRIPIQKQGGWRSVRAMVPKASATSLLLSVSEPGTEVQIHNVLDRDHWTSDADDSALTTTLAENGQLSLRWRGKVDEAEVDYSLTAKSTSVFDLREDGVRFASEVHVRFSGNARDEFVLQVPTDYLVEQVTGGNVRGWKTSDDHSEVTVTLLKPISGSESFTVFLSKALPTLAGAGATIEAPVVRIESASLEEMDVVVRRSERIDLQTTATKGVRRTNIPANAAQVAAAGKGFQESPLGLRPYQAYTVEQLPFQIQLLATESKANATVAVQTVVRLGQRSTSVESLLIYKNQNAGSPIYDALVKIPAALDVEDVVGPQPLEWEIVTAENTRHLKVYFAEGQVSEFQLSFFGDLAVGDDPNQVELPTISVDGVTSQSGEIVAVADPAFDVQARNLNGCEPILLQQTYRWLTAKNREHARTGLRYSDGGYSGTLQLVAKKPRVRAVTVNNVKVTDRAVWETVLIQYNIENAGVRKLSFLLPARLAEARIRALMLRAKSIEPVADTDVVRVTLNLREAVMGEYVVMIEHDRARESGNFPTEIPAVENARTDHQFVALENDCSDEIIPDQNDSIVPLQRSQKQWQVLTSLLGADITHAYMAKPSAPKASLAYSLKSRELVQTAGAKVRLASAIMVLDEAGTYRTVQEFRIFNKTEQFLDVQIPKASQLWTVKVAGEPVKALEPRQSSGSGEFRIPIIKTADGDLDYVVEITYGGKSPKLKTLRRHQFEFAKPTKMQVDRTLVRLFVPESYRWHSFDGTMKRQEDRAEFAAEFIDYQTTLLLECANNLKSLNPFAQTRAARNLSQLGLAIMNQKGEFSQTRGNEKLRTALDANDAALQTAQDAQRSNAVRVDALDFDNRGRLAEVFRGQEYGRASNIVDQLGNNFDAAGVTVNNAKKGKPKANFNSAWFFSNKLNLPGKVANKQKGAAGKSVSGRVVDGKPTSPSRIATRESKSALQKAPQQKLNYAANAPVQGGRGEQQQRSLALSQRDSSPDTQVSRVTRFSEQLKSQITQQAGQGQIAAFEGRNIVTQNQTATPNARPTGGTSFDTSTVQAEGEESSGEAAVGDDDLFGTPSPDVHLSSLHVQIPERGREFFFVATGGEAEISALPASVSIWQRLGHLGQLFVAVLVGIVVVGIAKQLHSSKNFAVAGGVALAIGIISIFLGIYPVIGLCIAIYGIVMLGKAILDRLVP